MNVTQLVSKGGRVDVLVVQFNHITIPQSNILYLATPRKNRKKRKGQGGKGKGGGFQKRRKFNQKGKGKRVSDTKT